VLCSLNQGGQGYARKIRFKDIIVVEATNPVIIDQQYNPYDSAEAVRVSDVSYDNVRGTSSSPHAIKLHCDKNIGCTNIVLKGINITTIAGNKTYASCQNVKGVCSFCNPHVPCLSHSWIIKFISSLLPFMFHCFIFLSLCTQLLME